MPFKTWVARFVVDHGRVTEEGGRLRTFQRRRLDEPDVDLHVLAEPLGDKGDELGAQALDAIGRLFLQDRLSVTGGLLKAIASTHQTLLDWNRRSVAREQVSAGLAAAAISGNVVYLAQLGPSLVFLKREGRLQRLVAQDGAASPLGEGEIDPALRRFEFLPGDLLLAASPALESILDAATLEAMLERGSDEALPELYLMTRDLPNFALFCVSCGEADEEPDTQTEDDIDAAEPLIAPSSAGPRSSPFDEPEDLERAEPRKEVRPEPRAENWLRTVEARTESRDDYRIEPQSDANQGSVAVMTAPPPLDISRSIVRLRSDQSVGRSDYVRTTGPRRGLQLNVTQPRYLLVAAAAAVVLFVGAFTVPNLMREGRSQKVDTLVSSAQVQLSSAAVEPDAARKRQLLEEARRLAAEALRVDPVNPAAGALRQQATSILTGLDAVVDLGPMTAVATLSRQVTGEVSIEGLEVAGGNAYLLDAKGGRIIAVPLKASGSPAVVYQEGETYGGVPAKKPAFITWEGAESGGRLLILDAERKLFQVKVASLPEPLPLRRTNTWSSVTGLAAYDGNLYVLDPKGNQVHRYLPAAAGFDSEPGPALPSQTNLRDATGLAVEGDILLSFKDGQVRRFRGGADAGFGLGGIDRPLKAVTGIAVAAPTAEVYLADSGNKRVVVATTDGTFRRQLVTNSFSDIRALAIDSAGTQLYTVAGDVLFSAPLPH